MEKIRNELTNETKKDIQKLAYNLFRKIVTFGNSGNKQAVQEKLLPFVVYGDLNEDEAKITKEALEDIAYTNEELNVILFKFDEIKDKSIEEIILKQLLHYTGSFTGLFKLELSGYDTEAHLLAIETITLDEFKQRIVDLLKGNVALETKELVKVLNEIDPKLLEEVVKETKNKEVKALALRYGILPKDPEEFMRAVLYFVTDEPLMIKNDSYLDAVENGRNPVKYFKEYIVENGYKGLAEIFNRYKEYFIALKAHDGMRSYVNKISKLSKKYHKPKEIPNYLQVTSGNLSLDEVKRIAKELDFTYLVKLANALKIRMKHPKYLIYRVRNGKAYYKENPDIFRDFSKEYAIVLAELRNRVLPKLIEMNIKVSPDDIYDMALPETGKRFIGNIPMGSILKLGKGDKIVGIHWVNQDDMRTDLDLTAQNQAGYLNWTNYHSTNVFSGDLTDAPAPEGATEMFKIDGFWTFFVHKYTGPKKVKFKAFIGKWNKDYDIKNPKMPVKDVFSFEMETSREETAMLGTLMNDIFLFDSFKIASGISASKMDENLFEAIKAYTDKVRISDIVEELDGERELIELGMDEILALGEQ